VVCNLIKSTDNWSDTKSFLHYNFQQPHECQSHPKISCLSVSPTATLVIRSPNVKIRNCFFHSVRLSLSFTSQERPCPLYIENFRKYRQLKQKQNNHPSRAGTGREIMGFGEAAPLCLEPGGLESVGGSSETTGKTRIWADC
jgi:hypothetical protein